MLKKIIVKNRSYKKGFSLSELLISVGVMVLLLGLIFTVFSSFNKKEALSKSTDIVISVLNEARQLTLFSKDDAIYGVHFDTNQAVLFKGESYLEGDESNIYFKINPVVEITTINLAEGGSEVFFNRLTGETEDYGSITLSLSGDTSKTSAILINQSGLSFKE